MTKYIPTGYRPGRPLCTEVRPDTKKNKYARKYYDDNIDEMREKSRIRGERFRAKNPGYARAANAAHKARSATMDRYLKEESKTVIAILVTIEE